MIEPGTALSLIAAHGIALVAPLALVEGPIVTIIAAWLAQRDLLDLRAVVAVVVLADLVGDALVYAAGRTGGDRVARLLRLRPARVEALALRLRENAGRLLIGAKLTHAAGAAVLFAAGAARVPFGWFMLCNTAATLPKSLAFVALGWWAGESYDRIGAWILPVSLVLILMAGAAVLLARRRCP
ncbi:DedA family protein [Cereibacter sphaeroides]|uniref:DedA family protein n=1 Tax=Cereibacter sphaeroides TaxID=1063 RepID=UPI00056170FC|nr:VTT domain-containing protein [Cereibacter sphaeroides]